ncbi:MAG: hypothetical protein HZA22_07305 [Nitrospirae bacterium]|nr:hypothetical protein [Nitrospirota bacterium]MBI5695845.1 hypothetical protein [Nitrospirota bacterium]
MNKLVYLLSAVALVFALGCTPKESPEDTPPPPQAPQGQADALPPDASDAGEAAPAQPVPAGKIVEDYAAGVTTAPGKARSANAKVEMAAVQTAVSSFQVMNGRYPSSLDEVRGDMQPGFDMSPYNYDPATGKVSRK